MKIKSVGSLHKEIYYFVLLSKCILSLRLSSSQLVTDPVLRSGTERVSGLGTRSHGAGTEVCARVCVLLYIMATLAKECVPVSSVCQRGVCVLYIMCVRGVCPVWDLAIAALTVLHVFHPTIKCLSFPIAPVLKETSYFNFIFFYILI